MIPDTPFPSVRGAVRLHAPLAALRRFRTGGLADCLFTPADVDDLRTFLRDRPRAEPVTVIGGGSNLLVRDGGVPGTVIRLGAAFAHVRVAGDRLVVGGAVADAVLARAAAANGLAGFEFLCSIPGVVGGAVRMNAGCYGAEIAAVVTHVRALDLDGGVHDLPAAALTFGYRWCGLPAAWIVVEATFRGTPSDPTRIRARMAEIRAARRTDQPSGARSGGSTFRNPDGPGMLKAWQLLDAAGCRGLRRGAAYFSEKHCNFLINGGGATAANLEALGEDARARVQADSGIDLRWEIDRIGRPAP